jgi:hypothetical protein
MSRGNGRGDGHLVALIPSVSMLICVVLWIPSYPAVKSCFSKTDLLPGPNHKPDLCVILDIHLLSTRSLKRIVTYLPSPQPDAPSLTTSLLTLRPTPNCSDSHFNSPKLSFSPFVTNAQSSHPSVANRPFGKIFRQNTPIYHTII